MENVAVQTMTLITSDAIPPGTVVATIIKTGTPSVKCKAGGQGIIKQDYTVQVTAITVPAAGATTPDPGPYTAQLQAGSTKVRADGALVCLEGDKTGTINAVPVIPGTPPVNYPVAFKVTISAAGQVKVKAA